MSGVAIIMMVLFLLIIWGGLVLSIYNFVIHPDDTSGEVDELPAEVRNRI